jgi:hypothetical protein
VSVTGFPAITVDGAAAPMPVGPLSVTHVELEFCGSLGVMTGQSTCSRRLLKLFPSSFRGDFGDDGTLRTE